MGVWKFVVQDNDVRCGERTRLKLTPDGCNEPFKDRYWCPKRQWFRREPCPFENETECEIYILMCGSL